MIKLLKKTTAAAAALCLAAGMIAGCGENTADTNGQTQASQTEESGAQTGGESETDVQETEAVTENQPVDPDAVALTIDGVDIMAPELFYNYLSMRTQMEYTGSIDWTMTLSEDGMTYGDYLKRLVESQVLQTAFWNTMAEEDQITLSDDDHEQIAENLASFNANISDADKEFYGFNDENVTQILEHLSIAAKVLDTEVEKQIAQFTEDEQQDCIFRTVDHILLLTAAPEETNDSGETQSMSESEAQSYKESRYAQAQEILERAQAGEDFEALAEEYNEDSGFEYSLNRNGESPDGVTYVQEFTDGAFALAEGEMAIVETEYGYHVMKCVSENNEELTQSAQRSLAVSKYNETYQQWLEDNNPEFYQGWQDFVVLNTPAQESSGETEASDQSGSEADTAAADSSSDTAAADSGEGDAGAGSGDSETDAGQTETAAQ